MNRLPKMQISDPTHHTLYLDWQLLRNFLTKTPHHALHADAPPPSIVFREAVWIDNAQLVTLTMENGYVKQISTTRLVELAAHICRPRQLAAVPGSAVVYVLRSIRVLGGEIQFRVQSTEAPFPIHDYQWLRSDVVCPNCGSRIEAKVGRLNPCRCGAAAAVIEA